jgi:glycosyltransferase involved in cell wall biosynthesis
LLTLGRLVPIKGLDLLIEALAPLQDVELNICGAGNARPELETLARRLDVNAIFHGVVTGPRKAELLSGSHGFALTSRRLPGGRTEGSPVALLEALSYGLAVVATDVGGVAQALSDHPEAHLCSPEVNSIRSGLRQMIGQRR